MKQFSRIALATIFLAVPAGAVLADDDRAPNAEERAKIEEVLRAEGFTRWDDIEWDDGFWEVDDAIGADNREVDLKLDENFVIVERD